MAVCVQITNIGPTANLVQLVSPQPAEITACQYLLVTPGEYQNSFGAVNPFALTVQEGAEVGGAILLLMAVAWVFRQFANLINQSSKEEN